MRYFTSIFFFILITTLSLGQELERRGEWGAVLSYCDDHRGLCVSNVTAGGPAAKANLQEGDVVTDINSERIQGYMSSQRLLRSLRAGKQLRLKVYRDGTLFESKITLSPTPLDNYPGVDFEYGSIVSPQGERLRTVISRPENVKGKLPAIFYIKWLACSAVEGRVNGSIRIAWELSKAGYLVYRVEVPGVGDSEGPDCSQLDLETEISVFKSAFQSIKDIPDVDMDNIFIYGINSGGVIAPIVANEASGIPVKGIIVNGTWIRTWHEHIIDQERRVHSYVGTPIDDLSEIMNKSTEFHTEYLVKRRNPADIIKSSPHLASEWNYPSFDYHFGDRSVEYFQEMDHFNIASNWNKVSVPTLVVYNEFDWMIAETDHRIIYNIVEANNPGKNEFVIVPRTDPFNNFYKEGDKKTPLLTSSSAPNPDSWNVILQWLKKVTD